MSRIRFMLAVLSQVLSAPPRRIWAWQADIPDEGRVVLIGLGLLALGLSQTIWPFLAAVVPGIVLTLAGLGWRPTRSRLP